MQRVTQSVITGTEPVSLAELKSQLRVTALNDDAYLTSLIKRAREVLERVTRRTIIASTLTISLDFRSAYPAGRDPWWDGMKEGSMVLFTPAAIQLLQPPTQTIAAVRTFDIYDNSSVYAPSNYRLDKSDPMQYGRMVLAYGAIWPSTMRALNSIEIDVTAGFADGTVPEGLKGAIQDLAAYSYINRAPCNEAAACACGAEDSVRPYIMMEASS